MKTKLKTVIIFVTIFLNKVLCDTAEDNWIEPNAWGREYHGLVIKENELLDMNSKCHLEKISTIDNNDNDLALVFYKKFIATLFNRNKMQFDVDARVYTRTLQFVLTKEQLERLESFNDPRDLDNVIMEICLKAGTLESKATKSNNYYTHPVMSFFSYCWDIFKDLLLIFTITEVKLALFAMLITGCAFFVCNRFKLKFLYICGTVAFCIVLIGLLQTFFECNKKIEVDQMLAILEQSSSQEQIENTSWWHVSFKNFWFSKGENENQRIADQLRKSIELRTICTPGEVLMLYVNNLFLEQLQIFVEACIKTFERLTARLSFPFNILAPILLLILIAYIITLTFKYILSPNAWASLLHRSKPSSSESEHKQEQKIHYVIHQPITEDRVSGENLKMLISAASAPNLAVSNLINTQSLPASGVQEVLEKLLPSQEQAAVASAKECDDTDFSNTSSTRSVNNSNEIIKPTQQEAKCENDKKDCSEITKPLEKIS